MRRPVGCVAFVGAGLAVTGAASVDQVDLLEETVVGSDASLLTVKIFPVLAVVLGVTGLYALVVRAMADRVESKRRIYDARSVIRLLFLVVGTVATLAVLTEQWVGLLFSLVGWFYTRRPYSARRTRSVQASPGETAVG